MKGRLFISLGIAAVAIVVFAFLALRPAQRDEAPPAPVPAPPPVTSTDPGPDRVAPMRAAFEGLESDRRDLSRQIGSLQVRLWDLELPADQARRVTEDMMTAQHLLKNPPMLGAFHDLAGIQRERDRVQAAMRRLQEIEGELPESGFGGFEDGFSDPPPADR